MGRNESARGLTKYGLRHILAAGAVAITFWGNAACGKADTSAADAIAGAEGEVPSSSTCDNVALPPAHFGPELEADPAGLARATQRLTEIQQALCRTALSAARATVRDIRDSAPALSFSAKSKDMPGNPNSFAVQSWRHSTSGVKVVTFGKTATGRLDLSTVRNVAYSNVTSGVSVDINHGPSGAWTVSGRLQPTEGFFLLPPAEIATHAEAEAIQNKAYAAANHMVGTP